MRLDRFDLNLLLVLQALLEERNVTRAAHRLHLGQSGTSGALARLREHFDDELLVPTGRAMTLTPLALSLIEPVNDTLSRARSAIARKASFDPSSTDRSFTIAASDYVTTVLLATVVRQLAVEAPNLALTIRSPTQDVFEQLAHGKLDLMILPEQFLTRFQGPSERLFEDTYACIVWDQNPLANNTLDIAGYLSLQHVTINFSDDRNQFIEHWFSTQTGRARHISMSVDHFGLLPAVIIGTQRTATLHRSHALQLCKIYPLRLLELPFTPPPVVETMAWPSYLEHDSAHAWLRQKIKDAHV
jgi:LysR family transcriptional regulator, nod-box dependent transcriptional activator